MNCRNCNKVSNYLFLDLGFAPPSNAYRTKIDLNNPKEFKVNDYKIIDWSLDEVTFDDSDWDADKIEELDDEGILDEESKYYIRGPLEITKMSK